MLALNPRDYGVGGSPTLQSVPGYWLPGPLPPPPPTPLSLFYRPNRPLAILHTSRLPSWC
jgi:hypothetical protein